MFEQVKLDYAFDALEPHIDTLTMETHYGKHHAAYTKNFNEAVDKAGLSNKSVEDILSSLSSVSDEALRKIQSPVRRWKKLLREISVLLIS